MGLRTVFRRGVVSGKFNVDLTPEFVTRLASSFGTTLDPGAVVTLGRDSSLSAQVAKRAMTAALLGTGSTSGTSGPPTPGSPPRRARRQVLGRGARTRRQRPR